MYRAGSKLAYKPSILRPTFGTHTYRVHGAVLHVLAENAVIEAAVAEAVRRRPRWQEYIGQWVCRADLFRGIWIRASAWYEEMDADECLENFELALVVLGLPIVRTGRLVSLLGLFIARSEGQVSLLCIIVVVVLTQTLLEIHGGHGGGQRLRIQVLSDVVKYKCARFYHTSPIKMWVSIYFRMCETWGLPKKPRWPP